MVNLSKPAGISCKVSREYACKSTKEKGTKVELGQGLMCHTTQRVGLSRSDEKVSDYSPNILQLVKISALKRRSKKHVHLTRKYDLYLYFFPLVVIWTRN